MNQRVLLKRILTQFLLPLNVIKKNKSLLFLLEKQMEAVDDFIDNLILSKANRYCISHVEFLWNAIKSSYVKFATVFKFQSDENDGDDEELLKPKELYNPYRQRLLQVWNWLGMFLWRFNQRFIIFRIWKCKFVATLG